MKYLPIALNITGKKIVIIGGGRTALQKLRLLRQFTRSITVVSPEICTEIKKSGIPFREKPYSSGDLAGCFLVYACTNRKPLNARIRKDAGRLGALVNAVDDPRSCDFISPAIYKKGYMTVAVSSSGRNVKKSIAWRDKIRASIL